LFLKPYTPNKTEKNETISFIKLHVLGTFKAWQRYFYFIDAMERIGCLAALPSFLAESSFGDSAFSLKARTSDGPNRQRQRRYLSSHRYDIEEGHVSFVPPSGAERIALEVALSIVERGAWTYPSWNLENTLAQRARDELGWIIESAQRPGSGNLELRLQTQLPSTAIDGVLVPAMLDDECEASELIERLCELSDPNSPGEQFFIRNVAAHLPRPWLCMLHPQREATSLGLDPDIFAHQRVDFAIETPQGQKLIIEIDGAQHITDEGQAQWDIRRDAALHKLGWKTWRIPTSMLHTSNALVEQFLAFLEGPKAYRPPSHRNVEITRLYWAATAAVRTQALIIHALLEGKIPQQDTVAVCIHDAGIAVEQEALTDLNDLLVRIGSLYRVALPHFLLATSEQCDLFVDVNLFNPLPQPVMTHAAYAWSRPALLAANSWARPIHVPVGAPRFLTATPDENVLDTLIRDLFRKDGFRKTPDGHSDQLAITQRILLGKDVVGLLPTGAGKSLPYMLAGMLLPGMTLYVGPLISLLQDQAERLKEAGIDHVEYLSSALERDARQQSLAIVQSQGTRFLLVSPERFLSPEFHVALSNRELWQGDISQVVIDECHCVSEWGHDFRPAYLSLSRIAKTRTQRFHTQAPLVALTGTASTIVLSDVLRELGITDAEACIRATNLDRPELHMRCTAVPVSARREMQVEASVRQFLRDNESPTDGVLVFCPFRGGRHIGAFSVTAHLTKALPGIDLRFYAGGKEPWKDYAVFAQRMSAKNMNTETIEAAIPGWAKGKTGVKPWADIKADVQRNFISGTKQSFRVLVATKAFGMGIDKPSIRKIIHVVSPTSPEAFYQEIGRAGRDRQPSEAELFFCDFEPEITDTILDPSLQHESVMKTYRDFVKKNPYDGGDFLRTFYFHGESFSGMEPAVATTCAVAVHLDQCLLANKDPNVPFDFQKSEGTKDSNDKKIEYAIVRLIHLGVVEGYLTDFSKQRYLITPRPEWIAARTTMALTEYIVEHFKQFTHRYHLQGTTHSLESIRQAGTTPSALYTTAAREMMVFIYDQVEQQRRAATRAMLEIARIGLSSSEQMRQRLLNYLQVSVRFTAMLEALPLEAQVSEWIAILDAATSPQDLAEMHGATQRVLASYPTHPGLYFISALSRPMQTEDDPLRSREDLHAAFKHGTQFNIPEQDILDALLWFKHADYLQKHPLQPVIDTEIGLRHLALGNPAAELAEYLTLVPVRQAYITELLARVLPKTVQPENKVNEYV
jgi:ATP-dependent DNA helicase RecQ